MKPLIVMLCMTTLLSYGACIEAINLNTVNFHQPIAITQTIECNKTSFEAYLLGQHKVTVYCTWSAKNVYVGNLCYRGLKQKIVPSTCAEDPLPTTTYQIYKQRLNLEPGQSEKLFMLYQRLFNAAQKE